MEDQVRARFCKQILWVCFILQQGVVLGTDSMSMFHI